MSAEEYNLVGCIKTTELTVLEFGCRSIQQSLTAVNQNMQPISSKLLAGFHTTEKGVVTQLRAFLQRMEYKRHMQMRTGLTMRNTSLMLAANYTDLPAFTCAHVRYVHAVLTECQRENLLSDHTFTTHHSS